MKGVAIFLFFAIAISAMAIMGAMSPVTAGKMNGKPGGRNSAHYDQPASTTQAGKKMNKGH